jgi:hypothetical protein
MIEASFSLINALNPQFGYSVRITRGDRVLLHTSVAPDTGDDLLTSSQCVRVIAMYADTVPGTKE